MPSKPESLTFRRSEQGFDVYGLRNEAVEIAVVPALGAKVISLRNLVTGYEWMWHPPTGMKLFGNKPGDDFANSTMIGWDECIPTIAPCAWKNRELPDHGEVWTIPWKIDLEAFDREILKTTIVLPVSPLHFGRSIELHGNEVHLDYQLKNLGTDVEEFLWAMHPLLPVDDSSRLQLTEESRKLLVGRPWLDGLAFDADRPSCEKTFVGPLHEGQAAAINNCGRDRIDFEWDTAPNNTLGLWLTRGGWNNYHHVALEPSNGAPDSLSEAFKAGRCGTIQAGDTKPWKIRLRVGS